MSEIMTIGLDLAKNVFQLHGADALGRAALHRKLRRIQVLEFQDVAVAAHIADVRCRC